MTEQITALDLLGIARKAKAAEAAATKAFSESVTALRSHLWAGGSTGDPIQDHVLMNFGPDLPDQKQCERYRKIADALTGKAGEMIIGAYQVTVGQRHVFGRGHEGGHQEMRFVIGLLAEDTLRFSRSESIAKSPQLSCALPIDRYASAEDGFKKICEDPLTEHSGYTTRYFTLDETDLPQSHSLFGRGARSLKLHIGDDACRIFLAINKFTWNFKDEDLKLLLERLGRLELTQQPGE